MRWSQLLLAVVMFALSGVAVADPPAAPGLAPDDLRAAIGRPLHGKEVWKVARAFRGEDPTIHFPTWHNNVTDETREIQLILNWKGKGVQQVFARGDDSDEWRLHTVWLFNDGVLGHKRYAGQLPRGLSFKDTPAVVQKALGTPTITLPGLGDPAAKPAIPISHQLYKKAGVAVSFWEPPGKGKVLAGVALFAPGDAPNWW
jgi:hypothetical protein